MMDDGKVITGCNVENVSYGLSMCAERNAIAIALSKGYRRDNFKGIAVSIGPDRQANCCGACRQVISEISNEDFWVVVLGEKTPAPLCVRLPDLLPPLGSVERKTGPKWDTKALLAAADAARADRGGQSGSGRIAGIDW